MGNTESKNPEFELVKRRFTAPELQELQRFFRSLAVQSRSGGRFIIASVFQAYYNIHGSLGARLFDIVTGERKDKKLTFEDFIIAKARHEKCAPEETTEFVFKLLDLTGVGYLTRQNVESAILSCLVTVLGTSHSIDEVSLQAIVNSGGFPERLDADSDAPDAGARNEPGEVSGKGDAAEGEAPREAAGKGASGGLQTGGQGERRNDKVFRAWLQQMPAIHKFMSTLLSDPRSGTSIAGRQVPQLTGLEGDGGPSPESLLLRKEMAWVLAGALPETHTQQWQLVFSSAVHGASFNSFLGRIGSMPGPSVLLVRDEDKHVFGGYASQLWDRHSEFYGDMKSFLFTLWPGAAIYRPSGANANIQWCAWAYQSEQLPNGVGFGGQVDHFGLFLSSNFDQGHSRPAVTFNSPQLSSQPTFRPEVVECWAVILPQEDSTSVQSGKLVSQGSGSIGALNGKKGTVLDRFKQERAMMNLVGIANASENVQQK